MDTGPDSAELWGRRAGRLLAVAAAGWLAYEIGQYLGMW